MHTFRVCMYVLVYVLTCFGCTQYKYAGGGQWTASHIVSPWVSSMLMFSQDFLLDWGSSC